MLHFVYTYSEKTPRNGHTTKTVKIWRIIKNALVYIGSGSDQFVGEFQLVMETMERLKALPRKAFERHANTGSMKYGIAWALKEDGIADIARLN